MKRSPEVIHKTMAAIKGKNTGIERILRRALTEKGIRYRLYDKHIYGHPDIAFPGLKVVVFCDSEFWHGYQFEENLAQLERLDTYWLKKIRRNRERDEEVNKTLQSQGYTVLRFWGKEIEKETDRVVEKILQTLEEREKIRAWKQSITELTTITYIEHEGKYLLLHRVKEKEDINAGKWLGVGGHLEEGETHIQAMKREVYEETGLTVTKYQYLGYIDFLNDRYPPERMYFYKVTGFTGEVKECDEGVLAWIDKDKMMDLPMWEGDKYFLPLLEMPLPGKIRMNVIYHNGELVRAEGPFFDPKKKK